SGRDCDIVILSVKCPLILTSRASRRRRERSVSRPVPSKLALTLGDEARCRGFDIALQPLEEGFPIETRWDRIQHLDPDGPGVAAHRSSRPEQPGIKGYRQARNAHRRIETHHALPVSRLAPRRAAATFRRDDKPAIPRQ